MIVVSDTSPVSNLILIDRLHILNQLFGEIIIPSAVHAEIIELKKFDKDLKVYENAEWVRVANPEDIGKVNTLKLTLDEGEAQAIALALEIHCDLLLMDERLGTNIARMEGLKTLGLVGVLIKAKEEKLIEEVAIVLSELRTVAGFWLGKELESKILRKLGEI